MGRGWAEAEKWNLVSVRGPKNLPPPNMATGSVAIVLGSRLAQTPFMHLLPQQ